MLGILSSHAQDLILGVVIERRVVEYREQRLAVRRELLVHRAVREREHLEAAAVGDDRLASVHELV